MKTITCMLLLIAITAVLLPGCTISEKYSKDTVSETEISANVECTNCKSNIDVSGLEKGCDIRCPACSNVCTY